MSVPHARRRQIPDQAIQDLVGENAYGGIEQRHVDTLSAPGPRPLGQCRLDADQAIETGDDIGNGDADLLRRMPWVSRYIHQPAHGLSHEIVARPISIAPVLAKAADRAVHQGRIERRQAGVVEAVLLETSHLEVLDDHVSLARQPHYLLAVGCLAEIQRQRFLAAIAGVKVSGIRRLTHPHS